MCFFCYRPGSKSPWFCQILHYKQHPITVQLDDREHQTPGWFILRVSGFPSPREPPTQSGGISHCARYTYTVGLSVSVKFLTPHSKHFSRHTCYNKALPFLWLRKFCIGLYLALRMSICKKKNFAWDVKQ